MSRTWFEEMADDFLATRGAQEKPRELRYDLAAWLEKVYGRGRWDELNRLGNVIGLALGSLQGLKCELDEKKSEAEEKGGEL